MRAAPLRGRFSFFSSASDSSRGWMRAEPNITMVSPTFARRRRLIGSMYSARIRSGRAGRLSMKIGSL